MLSVLSPAKKLDYDSPVRTSLHTQPLFADEARQLIEVMRGKSVAEVARLMSLSDALAHLNVDRYGAWTPHFGLENSRQAVLAFNGDVYEGLRATELSDKKLEWAQRHVAMLSGLYGVLRPLDLIQPYRLEMGTKLGNDRGDNLYAFWGRIIADYLNACLTGQGGAPVLVNLASAEYFKAVDRAVLQAQVVQ
ncbi:MAG: YaaA family protein, partial [Alcaligenaceae bacterium]|nr:YaaA family protein [Alcaligenaceae bacterium]